MEAARLANTSRGSLSRSCRTPRVLTPKYWEVGPGMPSSLNPGATRGARLASSWMVIFRWLVVGAVMGSAEVWRQKRAGNALLNEETRYHDANMQGIDALSRRNCKKLLKALGW